jgi:AcrR family transcriptional regulator
VVNGVIGAYIHDRVMLTKAHASVRQANVQLQARPKTRPQAPARRPRIGAAKALSPGVSPGAPFRHFESRDALMTAVAEEAQRRFRAETDAALAEAPPDDPLARFRKLGLAYLRWAMRNPAHFEIISSGRYFNRDRAAALSRDNAALIGLTGRLLAEAFAAGQLRVADLKQVQLAGRALVYGFARMNIDGHLPRWGVAEADVERSAEAILDLFIEGIARRCGPV